jgi:hypothetical protein
MAELALSELNEQNRPLRDNGSSIGFFYVFRIM